MLIYLILLLIIFLSLAYLTLPFIRGDSFNQVPIENSSQNNTSDDQAKEQIETIKLALKDLDLEYKIGKLDKEDFKVLKRELLAQWAATEKKIKPNPALETAQEKFCPACGKEILEPGIDRFCRFCGTALKISHLLFAILLLLGYQTTSYSYEIQVKLTNGTYPNKVVTAESISVLSLERSMEEVAKYQNASRAVTFSNLPEPQNAPYLIQAKYQGVNYSVTIPPNRPSPVEVVLEVFEKTNRPTDILFRMLSEIRYLEGEKLHVFVLYYLLNNGKTTFANSQGGIEVFIPAEASDIAAAVSVGNNTTNFQWLRLQPIAMEKNWYSLPYPAKPGERMYQLEYKLNYQVQGTKVEFASRYPLEVPLKLMLDPPDMQVRLDGKEVPALFDNNLNRPLREINLKNKVFLQLSGGSPQKADSWQTEELVVASPLSLAEKILAPTFSLMLILLAFYYLRQNPAWLQRIREREKIRLETELKILMASAPSEQEKRRRSQELVSRIRQLTYYLEKNEKFN